MSREKAELAVVGFIIGAIGLLMVVAGIVGRRSAFIPLVLLSWGFGGLLFFLGLSVFARGSAALRAQVKS